MNKGTIVALIYSLLLIVNHPDYLSSESFGGYLQAYIDHIKLSLTEQRGKHIFHVANPLCLSDETHIPICFLTDSHQNSSDLLGKSFPYDSWISLTHCLVILSEKNCSLNNEIDSCGSNDIMDSHQNYSGPLNDVFCQSSYNCSISCFNKLVTDFFYKSQKKQSQIIILLVCLTQEKLTNSVEISMISRIGWFLLYDYEGVIPQRIIM